MKKTNLEIFSKKDKLVLFFLIVILILLFFRPQYAFSLTLGLDDACYIEWVYKFWFKPFDLCVSNSFLPGVSFVWFISSLVTVPMGYLFNSWFGSSVLVAVALSSILIWAIAFVLWIKLSKKVFKINLFIAIALFLNVPILFYVGHRTTLSHVAELFYLILSLYFLFTNRLKLSVVFAILLCLTRLNDAIILLIHLGYLMDNRRIKKDKKTLYMLIGVFISFTFFVIWFVLIKKYNVVTIDKLVSGFNIKNINHVLFGLDWGLVWSSTFWLVTLILGLFFIKKLSWVSKFCVLIMFVMLFLCFSWIGHGNEFGYRYLIGSYLCAFIIFIELYKSDFFKYKILYKYILMLSSFWCLYLTWLYKSQFAFLPISGDYPIYTVYNFQLEAFYTLFRPAMLIYPIKLSLIYQIF